MKKLPTGIASFRRLITDDFVYVDKTSLIWKMIKEGWIYFLSRPRRFGKSLLISTLEALFSGERELFKDTWIGQTDYDWQPHPVIRIDFSQVISRSPGDLVNSLNNHLTTIAKRLGVELTARRYPAETLTALVEELATQQRVVILIDEYDRPIVQHLSDPDMVKANREILHDFFGAIKSLEERLRFVFITGVSRFSKVSLFSGMNNLDDISYEGGYATLTGITEEELHLYFTEQIGQAALVHDLTPGAFVDEMRKWYNGYRFFASGDEDLVFNPWSLINCLKKKEFHNYWFTSATPTFAIERIQQEEYPIIDFERGVTAQDVVESNHDAESVDLVALLFQTGYLTIEDYDRQTRTFHLKIPNQEVRQSLVSELFNHFSRQKTWVRDALLERLRQNLAEGDLGGFFDGCNELLAAIPYTAHIAREGYYQSLLYLCVHMLGYNVNGEVMTNRGRMDMVVTTEQRIYIFEFKIDQSEKKAIEQIKERGYAERYQHEGKELVLVGANFSSKKRAIVGWKVEEGAYGNV